METATAISTSQSTREDNTTASVISRDATRTLAVIATYVLSEEGRKASLLAGGNGHAVQELTVDVPTNRLHLVSVDAKGVARLKLRPRYQFDPERGITRIDTPPTYDAPPDLNELFRAAARNHQLEDAFYHERRAARTKRRDTERERRERIAQAFLADPNQRALVHPAPTEKRCYVNTDSGHLLFDTATEEGSAQRLPAEAHRRFRADLRQTKERNRQVRSAQLAVHDEKIRFIAEWIQAHGSPEQRARQAAGLLPIEEAIETMTDAEFAVITEARYVRDGAIRLQAHLHGFSEYRTAVVTPGDLNVISANAKTATASQFAVLERVQRLLPDSTVTLRQHRLASKRFSDAPVLSLFTILVTKTMGPITLRREYAPNLVPFHDGLTNNDM